MATFVASGVVAYVTGDGMGVEFHMVESESSEVLATWLARKRRQSDRHSFAATAEVKDLGSRTEQVLITRDLSAGGCFVKTTAPLPKGSRIRVRIEHARAVFAAIARVTDNVTAEGMGIEFVEMEPRDRAILEKWLREKSSPKLQLNRAEKARFTTLRAHSERGILALPLACQAVANWRSVWQSRRCSGFRFPRFEGMAPQ